MISQNISSSGPARHRAPLRALYASTFLVAFATMLAGCSSVATSETDTAPYDYRQRHPILISNEPQAFNVHVGMRGPAFSSELETALRQYVQDYREHGTGSITIQVPTGAANELAAASTGQAIHYALVRAGVPRGNIEVAPYTVGDHSKAAPLQVSYLQVKAVVPRCGLWPTGSDTNFENRDAANFGCAAQQNLAAMVANPADLVRPQPMTPPLGSRRANTLKIYIDVGNPGWDPQPPKGLLGEGTGGVF